jgi:hypothetical protein
LTAILGFGFGVVGIAGFALAIWWRRVDQKEKPAAEKKLIDDMTDSMHKKNTTQFDAVKKGFEIIADEKGKEILDKHIIDWPALSPELEAETKSAIDEAIGKLSPEDLANLPDNRDAPEWQALFKDANKSVEDSVTSYGIESGSAVVMDQLGPWVDAGFITATRSEELSGQALANQIDARVEALTKPSRIERSYAQGLVISKVLEVRVTNRKAEISTIQETINDLGTEVSDTRGEIVERQRELETAKEKAEHATTDPEREEYERQVNVIEKDIEKKTKEANDNEARIRDETERSDALKETNKQEETEAERRKTEAEKAKRQGLEID